jgi:hypothetical protein
MVAEKESNRCFCFSDTDDYVMHCLDLGSYRRFYRLRCISDVNTEQRKTPEKCLVVLYGAEGGNRTRTSIAEHRILSPGRLPVPPLRQHVIPLEVEQFTIFTWFTKKINDFGNGDI